MALKHVEKIRTAIVHQQVTALSRLRNYVSMVDGNPEAVDLLRGEPGNLILAKVTDLILRELGHETSTPVEEKASPIRREITRVQGKIRGGDGVEK